MISNAARCSARQCVSLKSFLLAPLNTFRWPRTYDLNGESRISLQDLLVSVPRLYAHLEEPPQHTSWQTLEPSLLYPLEEQHHKRRGKHAQNCYHKEEPQGCGRVGA